MSHTIEVTTELNAETHSNQTVDELIEETQDVFNPEPHDWFVSGDTVTFVFTRTVTIHTDGYSEAKKRARRNSGLPGHTVNAE